MRKNINIGSISPIRALTGKDVAKYVLLPGFLPRFRHLAFLISKILFVFVQLLGTSKLIDPQHPCLRPQNIGQYRFSDIILLAWQKVKFNRHDLPQAVMFFAIMATILLTVGIVAVTGAQLFTQLTATAHAQYFSTPKTDIPYDPQDDWAFIFLERIFGGHAQTGLDFWIKDGNVSGGNAWYTAIFIGIIKTYSQALIVIAVFMIIYLVFITLADAARSGQPFGEKFDPVWAPLRFALAIGLLMPVAGAGYNGAQMVAFQAAEWGSNLGTNLWHRGILAAEKSDKNSFITTSVVDPGYRFVRDMFLIDLCVYGYPILLKDADITDLNGEISTKPTITTTKTTVTYSFGNKTMPNFCGSITLPVIKEAPEGFASTKDANGTAPTTGSAGSRTKDNFLPKKLAVGYLNAMAIFLPENSGGTMQETAAAMVKDAFCEHNKNFMDVKCKIGDCTDNVKDWIYDYWHEALGRCGNEGAKNNTDCKYDAQKDYFLADYQDDLTAYNAWLVESLRKDAAFGWASAGAFYMRMAYALSLLSDAIGNQPHVTDLPVNFYRIYGTPEKPDMSDALGNSICRADSDNPICRSSIVTRDMNKLLHQGADFFAHAPQKATDPEQLKDYLKFGGGGFDAALKTSDKEATSNTSVDDVMGPVKRYLYDAIKIHGYDAVQVGSNNLNPLGEVINWGNTIIKIATIIYGIAIVAGVIGMAPFASAATATAHLFAAIGNIVIVPGFLLMFYIPFLPFMYFTNAVIEWIATIIEAVIGMPLWALSFITLEGKLFGNRNLMQGVLVLFDIILRPTIIVMSLLMAVIIFASGVSFFNEAMQLYMNAYGAASAQQLNVITGSIASLGMILVYMIGIYLLATSCFKIIDIIPSVYGRWIGIQDGFFSMDSHWVAGASALFINRAASTASGAVLGFLPGKKYVPEEEDDDDDDDDDDEEKPKPNPSTMPTTNNGMWTQTATTNQPFNYTVTGSGSGPGAPPAGTGGTGSSTPSKGGTGGAGNGAPQPNTYSYTYSGSGGGTGGAGSGGSFDYYTDPIEEETDPKAEPEDYYGTGSSRAGDTEASQNSLPSKFGKSPSGRPYTINEVEVALDTLGLNKNYEVNSPDIIKQRYKEMRKEIADQTASGTNSDDVKNRLGPIKKAFETLQYAMRFDKGRDRE